jgi:tRNA threonylcarbamoyladenosine biosynthesis protein TsaE
MGFVLARTQLAALAEALLHALNTLPQGPKAPKLALQGTLGSGKTALAQALCHALGSQQQATSPTFAVLHQYTLTPSKGHPWHQLLHVDAYRLNTPEARDALLQEVLEALETEPAKLLVVEWPEQLAPSLGAAEATFWDATLTLKSQHPQHANHPNHLLAENERWVTLSSPHPALLQALAQAVEEGLAHEH